MCIKENNYINIYIFSKYCVFNETHSTVFWFFRKLKSSSIQTNNEFSIQTLYSSTQIWMLCLFYFLVHVHLCECTCSRAHMHVADAVHAYLLHSYSVSIINSRKLIQFIAFTYWPESLLLGRDYGCLGVYENRGRGKRESGRRWRKERKWKHDCKENTSGWQDDGIVHVQTQNRTVVRRVCIFGSRKAEFTKQKKKKTNWGGNGDLQVRPHLTHMEGLWYDMVCLQNGFALLARVIK